MDEKKEEVPWLDEQKDGQTDRWTDVYMLINRQLDWWWDKLINGGLSDRQTVRLKD